MEEVIIKCDIKKTFCDPSINGVYVWHDNNEDWKLLFTYYPNELTFDNEELIGLTDQEAQDLHWQRDLEYFKFNDGENDEN